VLLGIVDFGVVCGDALVWGLAVCAATIAAQPKPIANAAPTRFIQASLCLILDAGPALQGCSQRDLSRAACVYI
jgi:hypothetical protein